MKSPFMYPRPARDLMITCYAAEDRLSLSIDFESHQSVHLNARLLSAFSSPTKLPVFSGPRSLKLLSILMISPLRSLRPLPYICKSCLQGRGVATKLSARAKYVRLQRKGFRWKYGEKMEEDDKAWAEMASQVNAGEKESMLALLQKRGYVHQVAGGSGMSI